MLNNPEQGDFVDMGSSFSENSIRRAFIRKVYAILMVQLAITMGFITMFIYVEKVKLFTQQHPEILWIAFSLSIVVLIGLACCGDMRRRWPLNIIFLGLFTLCESFMLGTIASFYDSKEVMIAVGICTTICLALTIFSLQTKWDFTLCGGMLFVFLIVLIIFGILAICIPSEALYMFYSALGAMLFSFYLVFDTQLMLGGKHKYSISPEEYIFAALNLYLDVVNIFLYVLALVGGRN